MKKREPTYTWMLILMICSQILLAGFVSYWLIAEYRQERIQLHAKLKGMYYSRYEAQVDSLLMKHLIAPTLKDSLMLRVDLSTIEAGAPGSDPGPASLIIKHLERDTVMEPEVYAIRVSDSTGFEEERMVRSVRLFINETQQAFHSDASAHAFSMKVDSSALLQKLQEDFKQMKWKLTLDWSPEDLQLEGSGGKNGLVLLGSPNMQLPALRVRHINAYLLGLMLPQFIFALILLSLSASALIIAYRSLRRQLSLNALRNNFMANISHELKTPVSTVKVALEALQKFDLKKDAKVTAEYLNMAARETERLEGLVGKVLEHQVLEDKDSLLHKKACDLNLLMDSAVKAMHIPIREREAMVNMQEAATPCMIMADPVYLETVIINLIDNSLKYAGPRPRIHISVACEGGRKLLKVRDDGPGIPDEYGKQVYDKFFRIPSGNQHNIKGYGLGLHFAALVMARLDGRISFRNLSGKGCEFVLEFPNN